MEYQLVRSKRKSISLRIDQGQLVVRAPITVETDYIEQLLKHKSAWINTKLLEQRQQLSSQNSFTTNGQVWWQGSLYRIEAREATTSSITVKNGTISLTVCSRTPFEQLTENKLSSRIVRQIEAWYKKQTQQIIATKIEYYTQLMGVTPSNIIIKKYRARWGSCNNHKEISFNYLLMMLPEWVIDYIVVHELSHLIHLNHSKQFWLLVERYFPKYRDAKQWLKDNQQKLNWR